MKKKEPLTLQLRRSFYQLSEEDFNNIKSRIINRLLLSFGIPIFIALGVNFYASYYYIKDSVQRTVEEQIDELAIQKQIKTYKDELIANSSKDIQQVKDQIINKIKLVDQYPYKLFENGLMFLDSNHNSMIIEFGKGLSNTEIQYKLPFTSEPVIYSVFSHVNLDSINKEHFPNRISKSELQHFTIVKNKLNFKVLFSYNFPYSRVSVTYPNFPIEWIAIGH